MNSEDIQIPSNKNFGLFFSILFSILFIYLFYDNKFELSFVFAGLAIILFILVLFKPNFLEVPNKLWMRLGILIGSIISPIILGLIYFLIFTPISLIMRLFGRDELNIKLKNKETYWIKYVSTDEKTDNFKNQF